MCYPSCRCPRSRDPRTAIWRLSRCYFRGGDPFFACVALRRGTHSFLRQRFWQARVKRQSMEGTSTNYCSTLAKSVLVQLPHAAVEGSTVSHLRFTFMLNIWTFLTINIYFLKIDATDVYEALRHRRVAVNSLHARQLFIVLTSNYSTLKFIVCESKENIWRNDIWCWYKFSIHFCKAVWCVHRGIAVDKQRLHMKRVFISFTKHCAWS